MDDQNDKDLGMFKALPHLTKLEPVILLVSSVMALDIYSPIAWNMHLAQLSARFFKENVSIGTSLVFLCGLGLYLSTGCPLLRFVVGKVSEGVHIDKVLISLGNWKRRSEGYQNVNLTAREYILMPDVLRRADIERSTYWLARYQEQEQRSNEDQSAQARMSSNSIGCIFLVLTDIFMNGWNSILGISFHLWPTGAGAMMVLGGVALLIAWSWSLLRNTDYDERMHCPGWSSDIKEEGKRL